MPHPATGQTPNAAGGPPHDPPAVPGRSTLPASEIGNQRPARESIIRRELVPLSAPLGRILIIASANRFSINFGLFLRQNCWYYACAKVRPALLPTPPKGYPCLPSANIGKKSSITDACSTSGDSWLPATAISRSASPATASW